MGINNIKKLSMNPHFYSLLMQSFLSGYEKLCEIKLPFMAIPILLYAESREKLVNANRRSRIDTLFQSPQIIDESKISGKTRLSGYVDRYNSLKPYCKEAIIILSSEEKIAFNNHKIVLIKKIDYKDFEGAIKEWIECALGLFVTNMITDADQQGKKASLRNMVSYLFQNQNLIASKFALFYRFSDFYKRKDVIDQFPVFAGMISQEYYSDLIQLNTLKAQLKQKYKKQKANEKATAYIKKNLYPLLTDYFTF